MNTCSYSVSVHWLAFPNRCRGSVSSLQLLCAVIAAHLNRLAADLDLDCTGIQRAIAGRASFCRHDLFSLPEVRVGAVGHLGGEGRYQNL